MGSRLGFCISSYRGTLDEFYWGHVLVHWVSSNCYNWY